MERARDEADVFGVLDIRRQLAKQVPHVAVICGVVVDGDWSGYRRSGNDARSGGRSGLKLKLKLVNVKFHGSRVESLDDIVRGTEERVVALTDVGSGEIL